ncbi:Peptidase family M23 [compost metagenome]
MKYDIEINNIKGFINSKIKSLNILNNTSTNTVEGINNTSESKNTEDSINTNSINTAEENVKEETQEEKDIREINEKIKFVIPVVGVVSSRFGNRTPTTSTVPTYHTGLDIAAPTGTEVIAATNGKITFKSEEGDYRKTFQSINRRYRNCICTL